MPTRLSPARKLLDNPLLKTLPAAKVKQVISARLLELRQREEIEQRSPKWHAARRRIITASEATAFLTRDPRTLEDYYAEYRVDPELHYFDDSSLHPFSTREAILKKKLNPSPEKWTQATKWGVSFEPIAIRAYEKSYNEKLQQFGLLTHDRYKWLGASVDGVSSRSGTIVEIKCPYRQIEEQFEDDPPELHYWVQVQLQMEVLGLPRADLHTCRFVQYADADDFRQDSAPRHARGCMLIRRRARKGDPICMYPPDSATKNDDVLLRWVEDQLSQVDDDSMVPRFWYLDSYRTKPIVRNPKWFAKVQETLRMAHKELKSGLDNVT